jgi:hypothetical protein
MKDVPCAVDVHKPVNSIVSVLDTARTQPFTNAELKLRTEENLKIIGLYNILHCSKVSLNKTCSWSA